MRLMDAFNRVLQYHTEELLMQTIELQTQYDARKSFYGKARVEISNVSRKLISYSTVVAEIKEGRAVVFGTYSTTTLRHIKEFLLQNGFEATSKAQIERDYIGGTAL